MANYGLKYQTQFDSVTDHVSGVSRGTYTLQFLFKEYTGGVISLTGGQTTFIQKSLVDDPFGIKGQSADIRLINYGNIPVTSFYSNEDDGVKIILTNEDTTVLFIGYLVQDDLNEPMVDYTHEIQLSATDSLGLLKGVILSDGTAKRAFMETRIITNGALDEILMSITDTAFNPVVGDGLEFLGDTYEITSVSTTPITIGGTIYTYTLGVTPDIGAALPATDTTVYLIGPINLYQKNSLLTIINVCLSSTNLDLITNIYSTLNEWNQDFNRASFEQTLIDTQTYLNGDIFDNCYSVLDKIFKRFNCSIMQAYGEWQIVHWDELREFPDGAIPGYQYDESFTFLGSVTLNNTFNIGPDPQLTRPLAGTVKGTQRGYKFVRNQFDYRQPKYLLRNYDFHELGDLIRTFTSSGLTYYDYVAIGFEDSYNAPAIERWIRVIKDSVGFEKARYLVLHGPTGDDPRSVRCVPFEVTQGDAVNVSFSFWTSDTPFVNMSFAIMVTDGVNIKYAQNNGTWLTTLGWFFDNSTNTSQQWVAVDINTGPIPYDGLLYIYIPQCNKSPRSPADETQIANLRVEYIPLVNDSTTVKAHVHLNDQGNNIKNKSDISIDMDDTTKNALLGTLFLPQMDGVIQKKTSIWRKGDVGNVYRLGEITTEEELQYRKVTRTKVDGSFVGIYQNQYISMLCPVVTTFDPTKVYVWGPMTIDYKNNQCSGTLYEVYDSTEPELDADYTFTYIYDNK